jgi:hypothetical protein
VEDGSVLHNLETRLGQFLHLVEIFIVPPVVGAPGAVPVWTAWATNIPWALEAASDRPAGPATLALFSSAATSPPTSFSLGTH